MTEENQDNKPQENSTLIISKDKATSNKYNRLEILDALRQICPISLYEASKRLNLNYVTLMYAVREFEFSGLLKTRIEFNSTENRAVKIIYFEKKGAEALKREQEKK